jgi:aspartokinase/homoserine dehydrogenase 1
MTIKILKFGGSSIADPELIEKVLDIIRTTKNNSGQIAVVVSAFGGVTDRLIEMSTLAANRHNRYTDLINDLEKKHLAPIRTLIHKNLHPNVLNHVQSIFDELKDTIHGVFLVKELTKKTLDFIMGFGERLSATILCESLKTRSMDVEYLDARDLVKTDENFGSARVDLKTTYINIQNYFKQHKRLQIITGFIGSTTNNETTTLGRGGSDYSAALFGAALKASEIEIWTDVDGVMTADPNKVPKAFPIENLTYEEAMEMSHFGAKVIYPPAMQPASKNKIPMCIKNTFNPSFQGTLIGVKYSSKGLVKGTSSIDDIALLRVQGSGMIGVAGISSRLFNALTRNNISVILISQASSEHSICIAVSPNTAEDAKKAIEEEFRLEIIANHMDRVVIERDLSIVAVVGENMRQKPGIAGRMFQALGKNGINIIAIAQGSSELNISAVINKYDESKALNALHEAFFLSDVKTMNLFLLGTGLIGSTLLEQIKEQKKYLLKSNSLDIKCIALGNIDQMLFDQSGIIIDQWENRIEKAGTPINLTQFVETMKEMNLPNTIFVDCTGSESVVNYYEDILSSNISIVTPNKIANSGKYEMYCRLKDVELKHGVKFLYETNVGAGLPVISTLNDLMNSGDEILKIEAILSGTLSYIFNSFKKGKKFSEIVMDAKNRGLSEPDPRDDLNGLDVLRKLLILAREIGLPLEQKDIVLENILPEKCQKAKSIQDFFEQLKSVDDEFEQQRQKAEKDSMALRYIATLEDNKANIKLKQVDNQHPFFALSGSDNMIVFTTKRYYERPLVIKGPGAGAEVTAAGVFADIIRISNYLK